MPNVKNILIFVIIAGVLVTLYIVFFQGEDEVGNLVSSSPVVETTTTSGENMALGQEFLTLLLNIRNLKLNDSIFSNPAFATLRDSSIILTQEGNEGRPNPFAPIGSDVSGDASIIPFGTTPTPTTGGTAN